MRDPSAGNEHTSFQPSHQPVPEQFQSSPADPTPPARSSGSRNGLVILALIVLAVVFGPRLFARSSSGSTPSSQSESTSAYPQLKSFYYGTYIESSGDVAAPGSFYIYVSSEDQQGNVHIEAYFDYSTHHCSGNVTTDNQMTLHCNYISIGGQAHTATFHGTIFPDGHIEGTENADDGSDTLKWNVS